eukprot:CAMPEP_0197028978 /NCGR_PEP_ID=MMETSP1384-20130603/8535_1 /TAXON_ID=29189 /ORGANISM="Ammonia sp." /LENGTH=214 /DNA_ID=CAMNT_0042458063 /DNA_START=83 /DNA_END=727 /DNA_ORIENTATION=-
MAQPAALQEYPEFFVDKQKAQQLSCSVCCAAPMVNATTTGCGIPLHCLCKKCVESLHNSPHTKCPYCDQRIVRNQVQTNNTKEQEILMLQVKCKQAGCHWSGLLLQWINGHRQTHGAAQPEPVPQPQGDVIRVKVKDINNATRTIKCKKTDTVKIFKEIFQEEQGIPVNKQSFTWHGAHMEDHKTLEQLKIKDGSTIHYVKRFKGGVITERVHV